MHCVALRCIAGEAKKCDTSLPHKIFDYSEWKVSRAYNYCSRGRPSPYKTCKPRQRQRHYSLVILVLILFTGNTEQLQRPCIVLYCFACRHGILQLRTGWADGPGYVTQYPLQTGMSYVYNFTITGQRGTLWWHAHISWLRASVHGAIIIYPKPHVPYPFPKPHKEVPIILGKGLYLESFYSLFYG